MNRADDGWLLRTQSARRATGSTTRWLTYFLLFAIGVTAIVAVVGAVAMGHTTVALIIGLIAGAFFAGILS